VGFSCVSGVGGEFEIWWWIGLGVGRGFVGEIGEGVW